jgi:hypothetical protein
LRGRDGGDDLTNVQYKPIRNFHNEAPLNNDYILIKCFNKKQTDCSCAFVLRAISVLWINELPTVPSGTAPFKWQVLHTHSVPCAVPQAVWCLHKPFPGSSPCSWPHDAPTCLTQGESGPFPPRNPTTSGFLLTTANLGLPMGLWGWLCSRRGWSLQVSRWGGPPWGSNLCTSLCTDWSHLQSRTAPALDPGDLWLW